MTLAALSGGATRSLITISTTPQPLEIQTLRVEAGPARSPIEITEIPLKSVSCTPSVRSRVSDYVKSCWPFCRKQVVTELSTPLVPHVPLNEIFIPDSPTSGSVIDTKILGPETRESRVSQCFSKVFGAVKVVATHPITTMTLTLGSIATAATCGAYLNSTVGMVGACVAAGFFSKGLTAVSDRVNRLVERFLGYWGYECVVGTNYLYYYHPTAGIILGGIFAGISIRQLIGKAVATIEQRNLPPSQEQQILALIEQSIELEKQPVATRTGAVINFLKHHWKTIVVLAIGAALLPSRSPDVLQRVISSIPSNLQIAAINVYGVILDMSVGFIAGPIGYHCERKLHQLRLDCQSGTSRLKSIATKVTHFFVGAGRQLIFAAGMAVYIKSSNNIILTFSMGFVAFALGTNASERHRRNTLKKKGITLVDLETGQELPRLDKNDLACIENSNCIQTMRNKWDSTSRIARFVRENAGTLFCLAGFTALAATYHIAGFAFDQDFQTTSALIGGLAGFITERLANDRWSQPTNNSYFHRIKKCAVYIIENYQLEMLFFQLYTLGNGFPILGSIGTAVQGFSVGSNRSFVNAGGRDLHPGAGFVSYNVLSNALL